MKLLFIALLLVVGVPVVLAGLLALFVFKIAPSLSPAQLERMAFYDYGIDKAVVTTPCASFFEQGKPYDFSTILWAEGQSCAIPVNGVWGTPCAVYTTHVTQFFRFVHVFNLHVEKQQGATARLVPESIDVSLSGGAAVLPVFTTPLKSYRSGEAVFRRFYIGYLPKSFTESIRFNIEYKGATEQVEYTFPLSLLPHATMADVVGGI